MMISPMIGIFLLALLFFIPWLGFMIISFLILGVVSLLLTVLGLGRLRTFPKRQKREPLNGKSPSRKTFLKSGDIEDADFKENR